MKSMESIGVMAAALFAVTTAWGQQEEPKPAEEPAKAEDTQEPNPPANPPEEKDEPKAEEKAEAKPEEKAEETAVAPTAAAGGEVAGMITYAGEMALTDAEKEEGAEKTLLEAWTGKAGLPNAVVMIGGGDSAAAGTSKSLGIKIAKPEFGFCRIVPRVAAARTGTRIVFANETRGDHRLLAKGEKPALDAALGYNQSREIMAESAGLIEYACERHPQSRGWLVVTDAPYFAVTDKTGAFTISGIPPGTYPVRIWHERFTEFQGEVKVEGRTEFAHEFSIEGKAETEVRPEAVAPEAKP